MVVTQKELENQIAHLRDLKASGCDFTAEDGRPVKAGWDYVPSSP
jgi:hypothetical protein